MKTKAERREHIRRKRRMHKVSNSFRRVTRELEYRAKTRQGAKKPLF